MLEVKGPVIICKSSLLNVIEVEFAITALDGEGVLSLLLDYACVDEVADEHGRGPVVLGLLLNLLHLLLQLIEPGGLGSCLVLLVQLGLFLFLDLSLSSPPLRTDLEHVDA